MSADLIREAVELAKAGRRSDARAIVTRLLRSDPDNAAAWVVMAQVVGNRQQAIDCLKNVLRLEPNHPWATLHLERLKAQEAADRQAAQRAAPPPAAEPAPPEPAPAAPDLPELSLEDLGGFVPPSAAAGAEMELDPLAGTQRVRRAPSVTDVRYDDIRAELNLTGDVTLPRRRRRGLRTVLVIVLALVIGIGLVAAYLLGLLPF